MGRSTLLGREPRDPGPAADDCAGAYFQDRCVDLPLEDAAPRETDTGRGTDPAARYPRHVDAVRLHVGLDPAALHDADAAANRDGALEFPAHDHGSLAAQPAN